MLGQFRCKFNSFCQNMFHICRSWCLKSSYIWISDVNRNTWLLRNHTRPYTIRAFHPGINAFLTSVLSCTDKQDTNKEWDCLLLKPQIHDWLILREDEDASFSTNLVQTEIFTERKHGLLWKMFWGWRLNRSVLECHHRSRAQFSVSCFILDLVLMIKSHFSSSSCFYESKHNTTQIHLVAGKHYIHSLSENSPLSDI